MPNIMKPFICSECLEKNPDLKSCHPNPELKHNCSLCGEEYFLSNLVNFPGWQKTNSPAGYITEEKKKKGEE